MDWLKKLAGLFKIKIDFSKLREVHLFSDNNKPTHIYQGPVLQVNIAKLDADGAETLRGVLREHQENGGLIIESQSLKRLEDFNHTNSSETTRDVLEFFKGKIPTSDLEILRYSIYLKAVFGRGESVADLKGQLIERFGDRGRNICNLYSAGYFETQIKPLYELMFAQDDFSQERFSQIYELIVTESPFAVFVSHSMNDDDVYAEVTQKIEANRKYGVVNLNLHGIGEDNILKINNLLERLKSEGIIDSPQEVISDKSILSVKLKLNHGTESESLLGNADRVLEE